MNAPATAAPDQVHIWKQCHACEASPIEGTRHECQTCPDGPDNDLCQRCHAAHVAGAVKHPGPGTFAALAGWRPGEPHRFTAFPGDARPDPRWIAIPAPREPAPRVPDRFLVRPEFRSRGESFLGSHAFVVAGEPALLLTALHVMSALLGERGIDATAANRSYSGHELARVVTDVNLYDVLAPDWMGAPLGRATTMLPLPHARTSDPEPVSSRDIAAFHVDPAARVTPVPLARAVPSVGEPIWLVARPQAPGAGRAIPAVVVEHTDATFVFRYADDAPALPSFASGSPLVNRDGEVVALLVGQGRLDGKHFGHGNHVASIRHHLDRP
jgi:hypothetical protein